MRLFKRPSTSPQLVSATPLSQDVADSKTLAENAEAIHDATIKVEEARCTVKANNDADTAADNASQPTSSAFSARKGISTWGRKVGRRWDQLKRSESTELLSVSGRRRRWSPNRKSLCDTNDDKEKCRTEGSSIANVEKPKRISRVESLRNLFRAHDRGSSGNINVDVASRNVTIEEEDDVASLSHYTMDKALSEGALRTVFRLSSADCRTERLNEKKKQISESIQSFQEQQRVFDYILKNQEILKTREGMSFAQDTLDKVHNVLQNSPNSTEEDKNSAVNQNLNKSDGSSRNVDSGKLNVKRNLFNVRTNDHERTEHRRSFMGTGLEDLMCTMRLGCDESGYDSDSTRAGADSPDSEQLSVPSMLKRRSFSFTSDDYQGIDLSLPECVFKKMEPSPDKTITNEQCDASINDADSTFDESVRTDTTLMSDDDDTDSCDDETFHEFTGYRFNNDLPPRKIEKIIPKPAWNNSRSCVTPKKSINAKSVTINDAIARDNLEKTPTRRKNSTNNESTTMEHRSRLENCQRIKKITQIGAKGRKISNVSVLNLLENASSPSKDSPPAAKIRTPIVMAERLNYYSPKRSRSRSTIAEIEQTAAIANPPKRQSSDKNFVVPATPVNAKNFARRELKTVKLVVGKTGNLGISVEKREAVRPFYVVAKLDANGEAAKSKSLRLGDEIVRISGRRLRGMSMNEARSALKNCTGIVELQIAREPNFNFHGELGDTWGEPITRTTSDDAVWTLEKNRKNRKTDDVEKSRDKDRNEESRKKNCRVVGALTKDGKSVSMNSMAVAELEIDGKNKVTGMKKFQVMKKRNSMPAMRQGRSGSLSGDMLTIVLEKGATKKLGFSIVGGSDSVKGSMGIFVKDVMDGGQAAEEGTLRPGDEIFAINGQTMDGVTHAKALQYFKAAKPGQLILHVGRRDPTHKRFLGQSKSYDCLDKLTESGEE